MTHAPHDRLAPLVVTVTERDIADAPALFPLVDAIVAIRGDGGVEAFTLDEAELAAAVIAWARRELIRHEGKLTKQAAEKARRSRLRLVKPTTK